MKISIIVPIYNVEKYILRCLTSIYEQIYKNIEVILINDQGKDNSIGLVEEFISTNTCVHWKIIHHDKNSGLSAARNTGIKHASGEYLFFLDSDDAILPDTVSALTKSLTSTSIDFVVGGIKEIGFKKRMVANNPTSNILLQNDDELRNAFFSEIYPVIACNKLINRSFIIQNNLYFEEALLHEDLLWSFLMAIHAKKAVLSTDITYLYFYNGESISSAKKAENFLSYIRIFKRFKEIIIAHPMLKNDASCTAFFETHKFAAILSLIMDGANLDQATCRKLYDELSAIKLEPYRHLGYSKSHMKVMIKKFMMSLPYPLAKILIKQCFK